MKKLKSILSNKHSKTIFTALCIVGFVLGGLFTYDELRPNHASATSPNVILISVDTLAANHLGTYGYKRDTSPNIDKFTSENILFNNAFTPVPCTAPSYASLFTGLYPTTHNSYYKQLDKKYTTLAESFKKVNYNTAGFISNGILENEHGGLGRGFDTYDGINKLDTRDNINNTYGVYGNKSLQKGERTTEQANDWLSRNTRDKFFLFVQYMDPHLPYGQDEPFKDKFVTDNKDNPLSNPDRQQDKNYANNPTPEENQYLMDKYDENIAYVDFQIGKLLDQIKSQGLYENSIIILTADHGESFDHGVLGHCWQVFDATVKIPLIIHEPGNTIVGTRVNDVVSLIDIYPTLSGLIGFKPTSQSFEGIDISPALRGEKLTRQEIYSVSNALPAEKDSSFLEKSKLSGRLFKRVTENDRVIYNQNSGKATAFDINKDPGETIKLLPDNLQGAYEELLLWATKHPFAENIIRQSDRRFKELQGLGYL